MSDPVLLKLVGSAERVEARLAAVDDKLDAAIERLNNHADRIKSLEHREARRTGFVAACVAIVGTLGVERLFRYFGG